ncbi:hypothetical protein [Streptomyces longisporus]
MAATSRCSGFSTGDIADKDGVGAGRRPLHMASVLRGQSVRTPVFLTSHVTSGYVEAAAVAWA